MNDRAEGDPGTRTTDDASLGATHRWRERAERLAPLVDGVEYYAAVRSALIRAKRQVFIVGWEIHSEVDLLRGEEAERAEEESEWPVRLADLLQAIVQARPELEVRLLIWEGSSMFALERQHLPRMKRPWDQRKRIKLVWDKDTPPLGSQHQKLVVVDDRVAFVGGMDLTKSRWDTHEHRPADKRRRNPGLIPTYGDPYHDIMLALDDEAARRVGEWCRERWRRATGESVDPPETDGASGGDGDDPWPEGVEPLLTDREVELALTEPDYAGRKELRQVEAAFIEQIREAEKLIFVETQYFASGKIADELCERLREDDGPEVILILPFGCPGKLQSIAMDTRRDQLFERLRDADTNKRFGAYWATLNGRDTEKPFEHSVYIHAKTMVIDDRLLRIGSANLNSRSMGLDTELDATVRVGADERDAVEAVAGYRRRLIGYLLGVDAQEVARAEKDEGSVLGAIESLRGGERTLAPFEHGTPKPTREIALEIGLADPERPPSEEDAKRALDTFAKHIGKRDKLRKALSVGVGYARRWKLALLGFAVIVLIAAVWRVTPLGELADRERMEGVVETIRESPAGIAGVIAVFIALGSFGFPIVVLIAASGAIFGVAWALAVSLMGVLGASIAGFAFGRMAPSGLQRRFAEGRTKRVAKVLKGEGVLSVAVVRNMPVAPFAVVNAAFGFTGVRWLDYLAGTMIGMLPGIVLLSVFGRELGKLVTDPTPARVAQAAVVGVGVIVLAIVAQRLIKKFAPSPVDGDPDEDDDADERGGS
ncbi:MAG: hypothetical protein EA423_12110 [Phycisphaerales bacterium]|nr:MAG: hypothetical protein EA423_12110 [Phycisphaerales bacterium]